MSESRDRVIYLMTAEYQRLMAQEPPKDLGCHPSLEVHEQVGAKWAAWDREVQAVKTVLSANLLARHLEETVHRP